MLRASANMGLKRLLNCGGSYTLNAFDLGPLFQDFKMYQAI